MKIFHHYDEDGRQAAAILTNHYVENGTFKLDEDGNVIGYEDIFRSVDYIQPLKIDDIEYGEDVWFVDFSFSNVAHIEQLRILDKLAHLFWVDHHKDFIELEKSEPWTKKIMGIRRQNIVATGNDKIKYSGAALVWEYLYGSTASRSLYTDDNYEFDMDDFPPIVKYVSDYDTFSHTLPGIIDFSYGVKSFDQRPYNINSDFIRRLHIPHKFNHVDDIIDAGSLIHVVKREDDERYLKAHGFITEIDGVKCLAVNKASNSFIFDSADYPNEFPLYMVFVYKDGLFKTTFFGSGSLIDCSLIAKKFGGGGHPGAAGCAIPIKEWDFPTIQTYREYLDEKEKNANE